MAAVVLETSCQPSAASGGVVLTVGVAGLDSDSASGASSLQLRLPSASEPPALPIQSRLHPGVTGLDSATVGVELQLPSPSPGAPSPRAKSSPECAYPVGKNNQACQEACRKRIPRSKT